MSIDTREESRSRFERCIVGRGQRRFCFAAAMVLLLGMGRLAGAQVALPDGAPTTAPSDGSAGVNSPVPANPAAPTVNANNAASSNEASSNEVSSNEPPSNESTSSADSSTVAADATSTTSANLPPVPGAPSEADSLKTLIGVNSSGVRPQDLPKLPAMSLCGFVQPRNGTAWALLRIEDLNRTFLVQQGTEIPVTVQGRVSPIGRSELVGLGPSAAAPPPAQDNNAQSQIIFKVTRVSDEGVTVEAGLIDQTIVVR